MIWFVKLVVHPHQSDTQKRSCLNQLLYRFCLAIANIEWNTKVIFGLLKLHLLAFIYYRKQVWIFLINRTCLRKRRRSVGVKQPSVENERQSRCLACCRFLFDIYCIRKKIMILHTEKSRINFSYLDHGAGNLSDFYIQILRFKKLFFFCNLDCNFLGTGNLSGFYPNFTFLKNFSFSAISIANFQKQI